MGTKSPRLPITIRACHNLIRRLEKAITAWDETVALRDETIAGLHIDISTGEEELAETTRGRDNLLADVKWWIGNYERCALELNEWRAKFFNCRESRDAWSRLAQQRDGEIRSLEIRLDELERNRNKYFVKVWELEAELAGFRAPKPGAITWTPGDGLPSHALFVAAAFLLIGFGAVIAWLSGVGVHA